jgi:sporadic carbohydrate cluster protein (TIGR04323 family)
MNNAAAGERKGYRGYVTSRPFGGYSIPVPVQSLVLRDYCQRKDFVYVLPVNENIFPHSYLVLEGMIQNLAAFEGVLMCSMHMMPQRASRRRAVFDAILGQGCSVHFVLEGLVIAQPADVAQVEELIQFAQIAGHAPAPPRVLA